MLSHNDFDRIAGVIKSAAGSTEDRFLDIGSHLEAAIGIIGTLTQTFDLLSAELTGSNLGEAMQALSQIMSRVSAVANAHGNERDALTQLVALTATLQQRVVVMGKAIAGIKMLAMNARIESACIGEVGLDFVNFASEIGQTLRLAQDSLDHLTRELTGVGSQLRSAAAGQFALAQLQAAALRSIPAQLDSSIAAIRDRGQRAVAAASAVTQKSRQVGQRISSAVAALQIGDITRQRLEHVEYALNVASAILVPLGDSNHARLGDWTGLTDIQRHHLATLCCRLQSAQLRDAADELDQEVRQILASIKELATDAREILQLGMTAAGASQGRQGTFLGEIEKQVGEVGELLNGLDRARQEADHVAIAVSEATTRLVSHTSTLQLLEGDIRIMGLNTSLKCGRLGTVGRPLMVIAQELRTYANQIAADANAVTVNLDKMVQTVGCLSGNGHENQTVDVAAIARIMANSVSRLDATGQCLADALDTLARDTEGVSRLLLDSASRTTVHEELGKLLRQTATDLTPACEDNDGGNADATPEAERMLDRLMRSYTMDRERDVLQRVSGSITVVAKPAASSMEAVDLEDVFF